MARVQKGGQAYVYDVDVRLFDELCGIGKGGRARPSGGSFQVRLPHVGDGGDPHVFHRGIAGEVHPSHISAAQQADSDLLHLFLPRILSIAFEAFSNVVSGYCFAGGMISAVTQPSYPISRNASVTAG